jgi:ribosomal protein S18 acetylase RimI-like enzyme
MNIRVVKVTDDLAAICAQMQPNSWAKDNEMTSYKPEYLKEYLEQNGMLLLAYEGDKIAGAALCYYLPHPDGEATLYIHELDTHPDFRQQGVATQLMQEAFRLAKEMDLDEVWIGADDDNPTANALYKKLGPSEADPGTTYSYEVK